MQRTVFMSGHVQGKEYGIRHMKELKYNEAIRYDKGRFAIENVLKDLKSFGFQIERSKMKKQDRLKRLLALCIGCSCYFSDDRSVYQNEGPLFLNRDSYRGSTPWRHHDSLFCIGKKLFLISETNH